MKGYWIWMEDNLLQVVLPIAAFQICVNEANWLQEENKLIFFVDFRHQSAYINSKFIA